MQRSNEEPSLPAFDFGIPTRLVFGWDSLERLAKLPLPGRRALLLTTSGGSIRRTGTLPRVETLLKARGIEWAFWNRISANPTEAEADAAADFARSEGVDFVIGLGGGSALDAAKAVALAVPNEGHIWDYVRGGTGGGRKAGSKPLPTVLIPTTAGTGSEADPWMVLANHATKEKIAFGTRDTYPTLSIIDPALTVTVPPAYTAYQGFDALCHAMEAYLNRRASIVSDLFALEAVRRIARSLSRAVRDGNDREARTNVSLASTLAGLTESLAGCISQHSLEHAMSAVQPNLTHGKGLAMLSHAYFEVLGEKGGAAERWAELAEALGADKTTPESAHRDFLAALARLRQDCGLENLSWAEEGLTPEDFPELLVNARSAMGALFACDPVALTDEDVLTIFRRAYRS